MKKKKFLKLILALISVITIMCYINYDYISYCIDKSVLKPIDFINQYTGMEIPADAEIKNYKYSECPVDNNKKIEKLQVTVIVPKEQISYILYGQSTIPILTEEEISSEELITPENIDKNTLREFDINIQDVEIYNSKVFALKQTPFWGASRLSRDVDIIVTKTADENMREIYIEIDNLGWGHPIK